MTESVSTSSDAAAQRAAEQARLRKERREAKIKAGGSARLNRITGIGGRVVGDSEPTPLSTSDFPAAAPAPAAQVPSPTSTDPEEVDISEHFYAPRTTARRVPPADASPVLEPSLSDAQLRQMMLGFDRPEQQQQQQAPNGAAAVDEDPLMKMMSQMMASGGVPGFGPGGPSPFPPGMPGMPPQQQAPSQPSSSVTLWRILHALVAISMGLFFVLSTPFAGTKVERERTALAYSQQLQPGGGGDDNAEDVVEAMEQRKRIFFWAFATAEVVLLSSRFFLDKASTRPAGFVATALSYLPQPYRGYLQVGQRYVQIFMAVRTDILTCVFVLGVCTWWKGL